MEFCIPCNRVPDWCYHSNSGSSITIPLPLEDGNDVCIGLVLFIVYEIQEDDNCDDTWESKETFCHLSTDNCDLESFIVFQDFKGLKVGSYEICCYKPWGHFFLQSSKAQHIKASISTNRLNMKVKRCGMQMIHEQDITKLSQILTQIFNEQMNLNFCQHCEQLLEDGVKLEVLDDSTVQCEVIDKLSKKNELDPIVTLKEEMQLLFSILFKVISFAFPPSLSLFLYFTSKLTLTLMLAILHFHLIFLLF